MAAGYESVAIYHDGKAVPYGENFDGAVAGNMLDAKERREATPLV
jgi:hypothetical protein